MWLAPTCHRYIFEYGAVLLTHEAVKIEGEMLVLIGAEGQGRTVYEICAKVNNRIIH